MTNNRSQRNIVCFESMYKRCLLLSALLFFMLSYSQESNSHSFEQSNVISSTSNDSITVDKPTIYIVGGATTFVDKTTISNYNIEYVYTDNEIKEIRVAKNTKSQSDLADINSNKKEVESFEKKLKKIKKIIPTLPSYVKMTRKGADNLNVVKNQKQIASIPTNFPIAKFIISAISNVNLHLHIEDNGKIDDIVQLDNHSRKVNSFETRGPPHVNILL